MKRMIDSLMGRTRVLINENERAVWLYKGEVQGILGSGEHVLKNRDGSMQLERQNLGQLVFLSNYEQAVLEKLPVDAGAHLTMVRTAEDEIAVIERDGIMNTVLGPETKLTLWTDAGPWRAEIVDIATDPRVDAKLLKRLQKSGKMQAVTLVDVDEGKTALVRIDGPMPDQPHPGG